MQSEGQQGQVLIITVLAMTLMLALIAVVVDGTNLFVNKRSGQNGADAAALAASKDLDPYGMPCTGPITTPGTCLYPVGQDALYYVQRNTPTLVTHVCANSSDANCVDVTTPYAGRGDKLKITVREKPPATFGKAVGFSSFNVTASAAAHVEPRGTPLFAFAMDTSCTAIQINGPNGNNTVGSNVFPTLWTNGGIKVNSPLNTTDSLLLDQAFNPPNSPCTVPNSSNLCIQGTLRGCPGSSDQPTPVPQRTCLTSSTCYWPSPIPANPCDPTVTYGSVTVGANWTATHPPGLYCSGTKNNDQISINGSGLDLTGYTFVAQNNGITLTGSAIGDTFGCTAALPCPVPGTVFYATAGGITLNSNANWVGNSQFYAPMGTITFTGSPTAQASFNGLMEAFDLQINAKNTTFTGTGVLVGSSAVFLDE